MYSNHLVNGLYVIIGVPQLPCVVSVYQSFPPLTIEYTTLTKHSARSKITVVSHLAEQISKRAKCGLLIFTSNTPSPENWVQAVVLWY